MKRFSSLAFVLGSILWTSLAGAPSDGRKQTFAEVVQKFLVERNGEVVLDARISNKTQWQEEVLDRGGPWRLTPLSRGVFRYLVIHEYNRYHSIQLDRDQRILSVSTISAEADLLDASGPGWQRRVHRPGLQVFAYGEVRRPGPIPWTNGITAADVLALAGGLDDAAGTSLLVLRADGSREWCKLTTDHRLTNNIPLKPQDAILSPLPEQK